MSHAEESCNPLSGHIERKIAQCKNPGTILFLKRCAEKGVAEGGCSYFIKRKGRLCSHRSAPLSDPPLCSEHSVESMQVALARERSARMNYEARMQAFIATIPDSVILAETKAVLKDIIAKVDCSPCDEALCGASARAPLASLKRKRGKRVSAPKRMANPFSIDMTPEISGMSIKWNEIFTNASYPLHIDVGCAKGACVYNLSKRIHRLGWNHLGVEIRPDIIKDKITSSSSSSNLHYISCNFLTSASDLLRTLPHGIVRLVSFQFPDPWRRGRHKKRLILQTKLIDVMSQYLTSGAMIYLSTDSEQVALTLKNELASSDHFEMYTTGMLASSNSGIEPNAIVEPANLDPVTVLQDKDGWLAFNPLAEPSERELVCEIQWRRVFRCIFLRK